MDIPSVSLAVSTGDSWWDIAAAMGTIVGAIATALAAAYAVRSAKFAAMAAETANKQLEFSSKPYVVFTNIGISKAGVIVFEIENIGNSGAIFRISSLEYQGKNIPHSVIDQSIDPRQKKHIKINVPSPTGTATAEVKFEYWVATEITKKNQKERKILVNWLTEQADILVDN